MLQDRPCHCGCGLSPASSSRTPPSMASQPPPFARTLSSCQTSLTPHRPIPQKRERTRATCFDDTDDAQPTIDGCSSRSNDSGWTSHDSDRPHQIKFRRISVASYVPVMILVVLSLLIFHVQADRPPVPSLAAPTPAPVPLSGRQAGTQTPDDSFVVDVSEAVICEMLNITFNPSKGTPPFQVMVSVEDYWPYTVQLPRNYDAADKSLWLYQFPVPRFVDETKNPNIIVSVTDSTGQLANSSIIQRAQNGTNPNPTCAPYAGGTDFIFYTEGAPSQCQDYPVFWLGNYTAPLDIVFLPEQMPPIRVPVTNPAAGNLTWTLALAGGSRFLFNMGDAGAFGSGGVSHLNIVALNEYISSDCLRAPGLVNQVLPAQTTLGSATVFPDRTSTFASLTTDDGVVSVVTVRQTIRNGRPVGSGGNLSTGLIAGLVSAGAVIGIICAMVLWFVYRTKQKKRQNIKKWDLPGDSSVPFNINSNLPIAPGIFGTKGRGRQGVARLESDDGSSSAAGTRRQDPSSVNSRTGLARAPSTQTSVRSWTSSAFEAMGLAGNRTSRGGSSADAYALVNTNISPPTSAVIGNSYPAPYGNDSYGPPWTSSSSESRSPTDGSTGVFAPYRDEPATPEGAAASNGWMAFNSLPSHLGSMSNSIGSDDDQDGYARRRNLGSRDWSVTSKTGRAGAGPTHRPDLAHGVGSYQHNHDLLTNSSSPPGSMSCHFGPLPASVAGDAGLAYDSMSVDRHSQRRFHMTAQPSISGSDMHADSYSSRRGSFGGTNARIIRHADAGLLLDDSIDDSADLDGQFVELPPQYESISQQQRSGGSHRPTVGSRLREQQLGLGQGDMSANQSTDDLGTATPSRVGEDDEDEEEFWTGPNRQ